MATVCYAWDDNIFSWKGIQYHCFADVSLWLRLLSIGDAYFIINCLSSYRVHKGQEQRKPEVSMKCITERFYILEPSRKIGYINNLIKYNESIKTYKDLLSNYKHIKSPELDLIKDKLKINNLF